MGSRRSYPRRRIPKTNSLLSVFSCASSPRPSISLPLPWPRDDKGGESDFPISHFVQGSDLNMTRTRRIVSRHDLYTIKSTPPFAPPALRYTPDDPEHCIWRLLIFECKCGSSSSMCAPDTIHSVTRRDEAESCVKLSSFPPSPLWGGRPQASSSSRRPAVPASCGLGELSGCGHWMLVLALHCARFPISEYRIVSSHVRMDTLAVGTCSLSPSNSSLTPAAGVPRLGWV